ncbi:jg21076 [Pararge aegeria aegeria]|uniref:Jg21076 protein n=1 Tax=Pararge aegeria aegeria TaxID=348720 RepID=A0A8S4RSM1_9NEOP|nr:jg21076 [Pararge aegeria aegeria]
MQHMIQASPILEKLKHFQQVLSYRIQLTTSQKVVLWSLGVVGTSAVVVGILSRYLARRRAKPIFNPRIQRAINKRLSRMRSPNGGMGSVASSGGRSSPLGFSERLSLASGSIGSGGGDAAPLSPQQLGVMDQNSVVATNPHLKGDTLEGD